MGVTAGRAIVASVIALRRDTLLRGQGLLRRANTTPGRLRLASILLVAGLGVTWAVVLSVLLSRQGAARAVGDDAAPLLLDTTELYVALADADATASRAFLQGGPESVELRERYLDDLDKAAEHLTAIGGHADTSSEMRQALVTINAGVADYAGRVESARANGRQDLVVGAAYLRDASRIMKERILPAATELYGVAGRRLDDHYRAGTSPRGLIGVGIVVVVILAMLGATQVWLAGWTNRILNPGLLAATIAVVALVASVAVLFAANQNRLVRAQSQGSDAVQLLSASRILALRAYSDSNFALIERGTGQVYLDDFERSVGRLGGQDGSDGLLGVLAGTEAGDLAGQGDALVRDFQAFVGEHRQVRALDDGGDYEAAVARSLGELATAAEALDRRLADTVDAARARLAVTAGRAGTGFSALALGSTLIAALAVVLVLYGLQQRIEEYR